MAGTSVSLADMRTRILFPVLALAAIAPGGIVAAAPMSKTAIKSAERVEALTIPTPGEFFAAIDKQGRPNWTQLFQPKTAGQTSAREKMALMLGVLVADGYIAVEAQDGQGVKNVGKDIVNLAKKLNVSQSVLGRGKSIGDFADNNDWSALREELEATQNEVKMAMAEQKDQSLVTLVTVGAWVRGVDVSAQFIEKNYTPGLADLLRQPAILEYLLAQIAKLPATMLADPLVVRLQEGLASTGKLVEADAPPSLENTQAIALIMSGLVKAISE